MRVAFKVFTILLALTVLSQAQQVKRARRTTGNSATAATLAEVQELREALAAQQQQMREYRQELQQLRAELLRRDESLARVAAIEAQGTSAAAQSNSGAEEIAALKSDVADIKTTLTNTAANTQDEQKRVSGVESFINRFRLNGDVRVRYENFIQDFTKIRHRERIRLRAGFEGNLSEDFYGGLYFATGALNDPISTNETLTGFFERKNIGWDRGWITFQPRDAKWLQLTGGKFAFTWMRTPMTFDSDLNPEGFSEKLSFKLNHAVVKNLSFTGMQLLFNESGGGADSFAAGGQISSQLKMGAVTMTPAVTVLNWRNSDVIANAVSASTLAGQALTNATTADKKRYLSKFLYTGATVDTQVKTPWARWPFRFLLDYVHNPRAVSNRNDGYYAEAIVGQTKERGDWQFAYLFSRIEQDAVISNFADSDFRAGSNVLQHRLQAQYQVARNTVLSYSTFLGRTLDRNLQNAQAPGSTPAGQKDPLLTRMQVDVIYKF
jgi:hypothetical protein